MRPLERLWGPLGASLTALGASWKGLGSIRKTFFLFGGFFLMIFFHFGALGEVSEIEGS